MDPHAKPGLEPIQAPPQRPSDFEGLQILVEQPGLIPAEGHHVHYSPYPSGYNQEKQPYIQSSRATPLAEGGVTGEEPQKRILGLKIWLLWTILGVILILALASVAVGGYLATRKSISSAAGPSPSEANASTSREAVTDSTPQLDSDIALSSWLQDSSSGASTSSSDATMVAFYQGHSNAIYYRSYIPGAGWSTNSTSIGSRFSVKKNTPLAELNWPLAGGANNPLDREIRLYYLNPDSIVCDVVWSGPSSQWVEGDLEDLRLRASSLTKLTTALCTSNNNTSQWIYFQDANGIIQEYGRQQEKWARAAKGGPQLQALLGTGIAISRDSIPSTSQNRLRLFAQSTSGDLLMKFYNGTDWIPEVPIYKPGGNTPRTHLAATSTLKSDNSLGTVALYFVDKDGQVRELKSEGLPSSSWDQTPNTLTPNSNLKAAREGPIAATIVTQKAKVYFDIQSGVGIREIVQDESTSSAWTLTDFVIA